MRADDLQLKSNKSENKEEIIHYNSIKVSLNSHYLWTNWLDLRQTITGFYRSFVRNALDFFFLFV